VPLTVTDIAILQQERFTADGAVTGAAKYFAGVLIESGAAATTVNIRDGTLVTDPIVQTFKVDVANTTRVFAMPGLIKFTSGIFVDMDANTASVTVFYA